MRDTVLLKQEYDTKGFAVLKQAIPKYLCKEMLGKIQDFEHSVDNHSDKVRGSCVFINELSDKQCDGIDSSLYSDKIYIIGNVVELIPEILTILTHSSFAYIGNTILKTNNPIYHFSNITIKAAHYGPRSGLHRDFPNKYICPFTSDFLRLIVCLTDGNANNGGLGFITGSHHCEDEQTHQQLSAQYSYDMLEYPECNQGDIIVVHPKVIHGGTSNRSTVHRYYCVSQWGMPADEFLYFTEEKFTGVPYRDLVVVTQ